MLSVLANILTRARQLPGSFMVLTFSTSPRSAKPCLHKNRTARTIWPRICEFSAIWDWRELLHITSILLAGVPVEHQQLVETPDGTKAWSGCLTHHSALPSWKGLINRPTFVLQCLISLFIKRAQAPHNTASRFGLYLSHGYFCNHLVLNLWLQPWEKVVGGVRGSATCSNRREYFSAFERLEASVHDD